MYIYKSPLYQMREILQMLKMHFLKNKKHDILRLIISQFFLSFFLFKDH